MTKWKRTSKRFYWPSSNGWPSGSPSWPISTRTGDSSTTRRLRSKWPCALLDIDEVPFSQIGGGGQIADGVTVEILAANLRLVSSSAAAPRKADAYRLIELLDKIHSALQRFTDGTFGPMFRTQIKKIAAVRAGECYKVLYQTAYTLPGVQEGQSAKLPPSSIRLEMK